MSKDIVKTLHPYEVAVLKVLEKETMLDELVDKTKLQEIQIKRAFQWLENKNLVKTENINTKSIVLGSNGKKYAKEGLPETRFLKSLTEEFVSTNVLEKNAKLEQGEINIVIGTLKRKGAIDITKDKGLQVKITPVGLMLLKKPSPEGEFLKKKFPIDLISVEDLEKLAYDNLKTRKDIVLIDENKTIKASITKEGEELKKELKNFKTDTTDKLTSDMLKDGSWKNKTFRHYDVEINVPKINGGKKHFVNQAIEYMKQIWIELGFEEMSGNICQTSCWDLDSLFVPQDHPARQMQDSFFLQDHKNEKAVLRGKLPKIADTLKEVHENGGDTGSLGWGGTWSKDFASEVMLRTHTTVLSAQYLQKIEKDDNGKIIPRKFFSVNKVFRNETPDWKHLFEFNQVEGIVVDEDANMQNLLGYLKSFFGKMGFTDVRMRPAHFPYTEPSCEIEVFNPKKKQWIELGGSGIFRPEVTKTLIGKEVPVLAWGLGMERIIVEYFDLHDLRDLYKNDIKQLKEMKSWVKFSQ